MFQWGIWLIHMVNTQYTITCAMLSAAAVFWFMTTPERLSVREFVLKNVPTVLLLVLAFQLRPEMLLLTLPFVGFAGWFLWWEEKPALTPDKLKKYGLTAGLLLFGFLLSVVIDLAAYGSAEWRDFRRFFDARTTVYDFYPDVVTQDAYGGGLLELGVSSSQQTLLCNYNFGLDEGIDTKMMEKTADYAVDVVGGGRNFAAVLRTAFLDMCTVPCIRKMGRIIFL